MAYSGHRVIGVDIDSRKLRALKRAQSLVIEPELAEIVERVVREGRLTVTASPVKAVRESDLSVICVGTPSNHNGNIDLEALRKVAQEIGSAIKKKGAYHAVVNRSTVLPGTTEEVVVRALERHSGQRLDEGFGVCVNPEFLREGSSVKDFYDPPFIVVGASDRRSGAMLTEVYQSLGLSAPVYSTNLRVAEFVKYACNLFHAVKITFANEIGNISKKLGIDSHEVMSIFCADKKLNISDTYLRPGFAFGGSCLPKDIQAVAYRAKHLDLDVPLISSLLPSNEQQVRLAFDMIRETGKKAVGFLGLSFKPYTDDLRGSPAVALAEMLIGKGYRLRIHDEEVALSRLIGANKRYIRTVLPHISSLLEADASRLIRRSEVVVVTKDSSRHRLLLRSMPKEKAVIDLIRVEQDLSVLNGCRYAGICW